MCNGIIVFQIQYHLQCTKVPLLHIFGRILHRKVREAGKITGQNIENHPTNETQFFALSQRRVAGDVRLKLILLNVTSEPSLLKTNTF